MKLNDRLRDAEWPQILIKSSTIGLFEKGLPGITNQPILMSSSLALFQTSLMIGNGGFRWGRGVFNIGIPSMAIYVL